MSPNLDIIAAWPDVLNARDIEHFVTLSNHDVGAGGPVNSEQVVSTVIGVRHGCVCRVVRFPDVGQALAAAGLTDADVTQSWG